MIKKDGALDHFLSRSSSDCCRYVCTTEGARGGMGAGRVGRLMVGEEAEMLGMGG